MTTHAIKGKHAVVTGGGSGIGAAVAKTLSELGARLTLMGRTRDRLDAVANNLDDARTVCVDVADCEAVKKAFDTAREHHGPIAVLINNAGFVETAKLEKTSNELWDRTIEVNLSGVFRCTQSVIRDFDDVEYGRVINIASTAGLKGYAYVAAYSAAKHGVIGLTRSLALEMAKTAVTVNAVCPGYTDTAIVKDAIDTIVKRTGRTVAETIGELVKVNPQGRLIDPSEVAATVAWLCSDDAKSVNGQAIAIAGGEVM